MSYNPDSLKQLGAYWTAHGGVNLGVVGNDKHCSGYHLGRDRIYGSCACRPKDICVPGKADRDYSVQHIRDRAGLTNAASAIDLGKLNGSLVNLYKFSEWLVTRCQADAPGTDDIREVIYWSVRNNRVERYSGVDGAVHSGPGNGDLSHKTHTHISYYRDSEGRDKRTAFIPYFTSLPDTDTEDPVAFAYKAERWRLDGGAALVTTVGTPLKADGSPDWTKRLALVSGKAGADPRLVLLERSRLTIVDESLTDEFYTALATYAFPEGDCASAIEADRSKAYVAWSE